MRLLAEEALAELVPLRAVTIATPCGPCGGWEPADDRRITAVSIVRSGDCLMEAVREIEPGIGVGKILIQRDESTEEKRAVCVKLASRLAWMEPRPRPSSRPRSRLSVPLYLSYLF
jgi:uracil phosphoribosyltransferase